MVFQAAEPPGNSDVMQNIKGAIWCHHTRINHFEQTTDVQKIVNIYIFHIIIQQHLQQLVLQSSSRES